MTKNITRGTQIAYVPQHAAGDLRYPDVEYGFVTSVKGDMAFCRYFSKFQPDILRTRLNSEATPVEQLIIVEHKPQSVVDHLLAVIEAEITAERPPPCGTCGAPEVWCICEDGER